MKTILSYLAIQLCWLATFSQLPDNLSSAWIKGDNTIDHAGIYGTAGTPDSSNKPGARNFSVTWRDNSGNLWLFGGFGYSETGSGFLNDLWKYDPYSNMWTWVKGDKTINNQGVYGSKGNSSTANHPGSIYDGLSWTDNTGNLWVFGGFGNSDGSTGFLNALWKYNPTSNQWTWIKGDSLLDQPGDYGNKGEEKNSNQPGARYGSLTWKDNAGNLWLMGGYGYDANNIGLLNDLWKYNPASNQWTWVSGDKLIDQTGHYGTQGVSANGNQPGGRYAAHGWADNSGGLWLLGGYGKDETEEGILNDLWKYDPITDQWTWMKGASSINQYSQYGSQGVHNAANLPGSRYMGISWKDMYGDFWIFGGYGYNGSNAGYMNDLWKYHPASNEWTWVKGDSLLDQASVYGIQGTPDPDNKTGSRTGSVAWTDGGGTLWLFGGYGYDNTQSGTLNDLWKVNNLQIPLDLQLIQFSGSLQHETTTLIWKTTHEAGPCSYTVQRSTDGVHFNDIGSLNGNGREGSFQYNFIDYSVKNTSGQKIFYRLLISERNAVQRYSQVISFSRNSTAISLSLFPNPATQNITIGFNQAQQGNALIRVTDMKGTILISADVSGNAGNNSHTLDISRLAAGSYFMSIRMGNDLLQKTFVKQ